MARTEGRTHVSFYFGRMFYICRREEIIGDHSFTLDQPISTDSQTDVYHSEHLQTQTFDCL